MDVVSLVHEIGQWERRVGELVTPRLSMVALNVNAPPELSWSKIAASKHFYFPVFENRPGSPARPPSAP